MIYNIIIGHLKFITDFKHNVNVIFLLLFLPYEMWLYPLHEIDDNVYRKSDDFKGKEISGRVAFPIPIQHISYTMKFPISTGVVKQTVLNRVHL